MSPRTLALPLLFLLLVACGSGPGESQRPVRDKPHVYATTYPLAWMAERIGGDHIKVILTLPTDQDPATWKPDEDTIARLQDDADLIVLNGAGLERWAETTSLPSSRICDTTAGMEKRILTIGTAVKHTHGGEEHEHHGQDPLTWLDPTLALDQAGIIHIHLRSRFERFADHYDERMQTLMADLQELNKAYRALGAQPETGWMFAAHRTYAYPARAYGWRIHDLDLDPATVPDATVLANLKRRVTAKPATLLLWPSAPSTEVSAAIQAATGLKSVVISPCAHKPASGDFLSVMHENVARLKPAFAGS